MRIVGRGIPAAVALLFIAFAGGSAQDAPRGLSVVGQGERAGFWGGLSIGAGLGAGWEIRMGRRWYLNPSVDLVEHRYTGRGNERYRERLVNFGLGFAFQRGRLS